MQETYGDPPEAPGADTSPWLTPTLTGDEVHVWCALLDVPPDAVLCYEALLSVDEHQRAARFHFARDSLRYVVARATLRMLLARYVGESASRIAFDYGPRGKPALAGAEASTGVSFNLAHSRDWALYALARGRDVGIDIEAAREVREATSIAQSHFTPAENRWLANQPYMHAAFARLWTRKEAVVKATGSGMAMPLRRVDVTPRDGALWQRVDVPSHSGFNWNVRDVDGPAGFAAALALQGTPARLRFCGHVPDWQTGMLAAPLARVVAQADDAPSPLGQQPSSHDTRPQSTRASAALGH